MKICPIANIFAKQIQNMSKIGSTFFQFLDKTSKKLPKTLEKAKVAKKIAKNFRKKPKWPKFCQSGQKNCQKL